MNESAGGAVAVEIGVSRRWLVGCLPAVLGLAGGVSVPGCSGKGELSEVTKGLKLFHVTAAGPSIRAARV